MPVRTGKDNLLRRARRKDPEAWSAIYDRWYPRVFAFLMTRLHDSMLAEDLASDVFLNALEAISGYEERGHELTAWLFRIAHNRLIDHYRRSSVRLWTSLDNHECVDSTPAYLPIRVGGIDAEKIDIETAMRCLGDEQRLVIHLRFVEGLTSSEVANVLGKSLASVKILQHRALTLMKKALGSKAIQP